MGFLDKRNFWNQLQYQPQSKKGHYESYFFRANHPTKPLAFWVRYTIFVPKDRQKQSLGELWGIFFDGEKSVVSAGKKEFQLAHCQFSKERLGIEFPGASASNGQLVGELDAPNQLIWDLKYKAEHAPMLLLPENLYNAPLPKAKAVIGAPLAIFNGSFKVNGVIHKLDDWVGSENHNWGEKHTDQYAWGQVNGFDGHDNVFLEAISGKVKVGPILSPLFTILVFRVGDKEFLFNKISQAFRAKAHYDFFEWHFKVKNVNSEIEGFIKAPKAHFVALTYYNPPGGDHTCLNSKIATCEITLREKGQPEQKFISQSRAAFEILTDSVAHGLQRVV